MTKKEPPKPDFTNRPMVAADVVDMMRHVTIAYDMISGIIIDCKKWGMGKKSIKKYINGTLKNALNRQDREGELD